MRRNAGWAIVASLLSASVVCANAGPPPLPKGRKVTEPRVRFEGLDNYTGHVFYLYYRTVFFNFGQGLVEVKGAEPIVLHFKTKEFVPQLHMMLLAVERQDFEKRKKRDASLRWLIDAKGGVLAAELAPPATTAPASAKEAPVTSYRITLEDGKLSAAKVPQTKTGAASPFGLLPPWTVGIVLSLSIAWLGIWFARRGTQATLSIQDSAFI